MSAPIPSPDPPPPRRGTRPLPVRRHLPGEGPHPASEGFEATGGWDWACELFDHRYYWEAHEAWEAMWAQLPRSSAEARFLQGLICGAASVIKHHQGQHEGARRLLARARQHLASATGSLGPRPRGIDVGLLLEQLEAFQRGGAWPILPDG